MLDQATKLAVLRLLEPYQTIPLVPGFDLDAGVQPRRLVQLPGRGRRLAALAVRGMALARQRRHRRPAAAHAAGASALNGVGLSLVLGGAVGNLIDRAVAGPRGRLLRRLLPRLALAGLQHRRQRHQHRCRPAGAGHVATGAGRTTGWALTDLRRATLSVDRVLAISGRQSAACPRGLPRQARTGAIRGRTHPPSAVTSKRSLNRKNIGFCRARRARALSDSSTAITNTPPCRHRHRSACR